MSVVAVSMVRDEADVIESTVRRMAVQVDRLIVADNLSRDGTREILDELAQDLPLIVVDDPEPGYYQAQKISLLAKRARHEGATWILPFDADEVWVPRQRGTIAELLSSLPPEVLVCEALLFDHVATGLDDQAERDPVRRMGWRRTEAVPLRKVACRAVPKLQIHQGNHGATFPGVKHPPAVTTALEVRHFPYRSVEQFVSKARNGAAAYAASNLPPSVGAHWRSYGRILAEKGEEGLAGVFREWFWTGDPEGDGLVHDPVK